MGESIFSRYDRQVWVLAAGSLINSFGTSIAYPFVSLYLYEYMHVSMTQIGLALMVAVAVGGLTQIASGELCDKFGRKLMMNIGLFTQAIAFLLLAIAIMTHRDYSDFLILLVLKEIAGGIYRNVPQVMIIDVLGPGERMEGFSLLRIGGNLGFALGPIFGGLLASYSYSDMFFLTALTSAAYMVISIFMLRDTMPTAAERAAGAHHGSIWQDKTFIIYCIISALIALVYAQMQTTFSTYSGSFAHLPPVEIGLLFSLNGFMVVFFQLPVARYLERFKLTTSLAVGSTLYAIGFGMVGLCKGFWSLFLSMFIITVGELITSPSSTNMIAQMTHPDDRGRYMNVSGFISSGGNALGPYAGGLLMDAYADNIEIMWAIMGGIALSTVIGFLYMRVRMDSRLDEPFENNRNAHSG
ncbi:MAG TPA: MFS transporter [Methanocellaceae archaeon]